MKNLQLICSTLFAALTLSYLSTSANALYYRAYPKKYQCFKDMISTNYVSKFLLLTLYMDRPLKWKSLLLIKSPLMLFWMLTHN